MAEDQDSGHEERDLSADSTGSADAEASERDNSSFGTHQCRSTHESDVGTSDNQDDGFDFDNLDFMGYDFGDAELGLGPLPEWTDDTVAANAESGPPDTSQRHLPSAQTATGQEAIVNPNFGFEEGDFPEQDVEGVQLDLALYQERTINTMNPLNNDAMLPSTLQYGPQPSLLQAPLAVPEPNFCQCQSYTAYLYDIGGRTSPFPRNCCEVAAVIFPHVSSMRGSRRFFVRSSNSIPLMSPQGLRYSLSRKILMEECLDVARGEVYEVAWIEGEWMATQGGANTSLVNLVFGLARIQGFRDAHTVPDTATPPRLWRGNIPVMPEQVSQGCSVCRLQRPPDWYRRQ